MTIEAKRRSRQSIKICQLPAVSSQRVGRFIPCRPFLQKAHGAQRRAEQGIAFKQCVTEGSIAENLENSTFVQVFICQTRESFRDWTRCVKPMRRTHVCINKANIGARVGFAISSVTSSAGNIQLGQC